MLDQIDFLFENDEYYEKMANKVLTMLLLFGRIDILDLPTKLRTVTTEFYVYAYRFARGQKDRVERVAELNEILREDLLQCKNPEMRIALMDILTRHSDYRGEF